MCIVVKLVLEVPDDPLWQWLKWPTKIQEYKGVLRVGLG